MTQKDEVKQSAIRHFLSEVKAALSGIEEKLVVPEVPDTDPTPEVPEVPDTDPTPEVPEVPEVPDTVLETPLEPIKIPLNLKSYRHFSLPIKYNVSQKTRIKLLIKQNFGRKMWVVFMHRDVEPGSGTVMFDDMGIDMNAEPGEYLVEGIINGKRVYTKLLTVKHDPSEEFFDTRVDNFSPRTNTKLDELAFWDFGTEGNVRSLTDLEQDFNYGMFWGSNDPNHPKANPNEWQNYKDFNDDNFVFDKNTLALVALSTEKQPTVNKITSAALRSKTQFEPTESNSLFMQLRVKLPAGKGMWPAWWMYPYKSKWLKSELDMFEVVNSKNSCADGYKPIMWHSNFHSSTSPPHVQFPMMHIEKEPLSDRFVTFTAIWSVNELKVYADGNLRRTIEIDYKDGTGWGESNAGQMIVNLAVGGGWPGPADDASAYPAAMILDYMGIWSLPTL